MSGLLSLSQPMTRAVFQRNAGNWADVPIAGTCDGAVTKIEARYSDQWQVISYDRRFTGTLRVPAGGWYRIEVRAFGPDEPIAEEAVEKVGLGEVFITAGQSNSANSGDVLTAPEDDRVSAWTGDRWQFAADPQPTATGDRGSPWPSMSDVLIEEIGVPIGLICVGSGGTAIKEWLHMGEYEVADCYPRLQEALVSVGKNGARAVLWHQGETDTQQGTSAEVYAQRLRRLIAMSREDAGWDVPWFIAGTSWVNEDHRANQLAIRAAQREVCDGKTIFQGPITDDIADDMRSAQDPAHFNEEGQREHGRRWATVLLDYLHDTQDHKTRETARLDQKRRSK